MKRRRMHEGMTCAFELSLQMPVWEDVDHRAEFGFMVMSGVHVSH